MYPVAVLAGGLGHRLRDVTGGNLPKAMAPVLGRPFIDWKLEGLARSGVTDVVLLIGHGGAQLREHVLDGRQFGLDVVYVEDGPHLRGTGGAILRALGVLPDSFWVTYGDTLLAVDLRAAEARLDGSECLALMTVLHNRDRWQPSNVVVGRERILAYGKSPAPAGAEHIDYGMLAFRRTAWAGLPRDHAFDLEQVLQPLIRAHRVAPFEVSERFHDIGDPEALRATEKFLDSGRPGPTA